MQAEKTRQYNVFCEVSMLAFEQHTNKLLVLTHCKSDVMCVYCSK